MGAIEDQEQINREKAAQDLKGLKKLGKQGKLWSIEVYGKHGNELKHHTLTNQTDAQVWRFRDTIFRVGLMLPVDPGHWVLLSPWNLKEVNFWKQDSYYEDSFK